MEFCWFSFPYSKINAIMWEKLEVIPMKKYSIQHIIMAFIVGVLVMISGQALADTVSQIGNKVDSEAVVIVNDERVSDAIIIKGKSYTPSRDVAEALGGTVEWKGSENSIVITKSNELNFEELQAHSKAKVNVDSTKSEIERLENSLAKAKVEVETANGIYKDFVVERIANLEVEIEEAKANLAKYEKELADLEAGK